MSKRILINEETGEDTGAGETVLSAGIEEKEVPPYRLGVDEAIEVTRHADPFGIKAEDRLQALIGADTHQLIHIGGKQLSEAL